MQFLGHTFTKEIVSYWSEIQVLLDIYIFSDDPVEVYILVL